MNKSTELPVKDMGSNGSIAFSGQGGSVVEEVYGKSAALFAGIIRKKLPDVSKRYVLGDFGAHRGDLMRQIIGLLPEYNFHTIALDVNKSDLDANNIADEKIVMNSVEIPLPDTSVDILMARYAIHWNSAEDQKKIIKEMGRVTNRFMIIQHVGPSDPDAENYRDIWSSLYTGNISLKLKRDSFYSSSEGQIADWMKEAGLVFEKVDQKLIKNRSDIYRTRYLLSSEEDLLIKTVLGSYDYTIRTTWVVHKIKSKDGDE